MNLSSCSAAGTAFFPPSAALAPLVRLGNLVLPFELRVGVLVSCAGVGVDADVDDVPAAVCSPSPDAGAGVPAFAAGPAGLLLYLSADEEDALLLLCRL